MCYANIAEKIEKLTDKCGNEEIAKFLCECSHGHNGIRWIPFDEFRNVEYLARGGFGEIYKATWNDYIYGGEKDVVLKRIYNFNNKTLDILKEVKKKKFKY